MSFISFLSTGLGHKAGDPGSPVSLLWTLRGTAQNPDLGAGRPAGSGAQHLRPLFASLDPKGLRGHPTVGTVKEKKMKQLPRGWKIPEPHRPASVRGGAKCLGRVR